jgi:hypothetical protein
MMPKPIPAYLPLSLVTKTLRILRRLCKVVGQGVGQGRWSSELTASRHLHRSHHSINNLYISGTPAEVATQSHTSFSRPNTKGLEI